MHGSVITLDVSKGNCHYQGFMKIDKTFTKPKILSHTKKSFSELWSYKEHLDENSLSESVFVFEATGVYHRPLQKYLDDQHATYYVISPLMSAKYRQTTIHGNKTDALDCKNIAKVFYSETLRIYRQEEEPYHELRKLNRRYEEQLVHLRKYKVSFKTNLDIVFPNFDKAFQKNDIYTDVPMNLLKKYSHPDIIIKTKEEVILKYLMKSTKGHTLRYISNFIQKVKQCAEETYSGCQYDAIEVGFLKDMIDEIQKQIFICDSLLKQLVCKAQILPNFEVIRSIVGIGDNLASRIIAEIGDISRFNDRNEIVSYAGVDPMIRQSGQVSGEHLKISKKGNKYLRCLLYLAVTCNYRIKKGDPVYQFNQKKRQQLIPLKSKAANIASSHKLLVIIYGMCKNGTTYQF